MPGPRILTSLQALTETSGDAAIDAPVGSRAQAARRGFHQAVCVQQHSRRRPDYLTQAQIEAVCGEAKSLGLRTIVHAHSAESARVATLAGCTSIEHGAYVTDDVLDLMAQRGTYYDPKIGLMLQHYLENKAKYFGIGNYNEEGFALMEKGVAITLETFKKALKHKNLRSFTVPMRTPGLTGRTIANSSYESTTAGRAQCRR